jgi:hypothetical protein
LYESCIQRMEIFVDEAPKHKFKFFEETLATVKSPEHPNLQYFIYKSIILQNLYGVDIMKEAVEIAKLRLFLKLVATVEADYKKPNLGLEPLPDIDFNIRAGNTLIGFATEFDLKKGLDYTFDGPEAKPIIEEKCEVVSKAFENYKKIQLSYGDDFNAFKKAKELLNERLKELNSELNKLLHLQAPTLKYEKWLNTHLPFHWFAEFYEIIQSKGGFDIIIGNPPYVVYSAANSPYKVSEYSTLTCSNLYAFCCERSFKIMNELGRFGMIVPNSSISADKLSPLQKIITKEKITWISNYSWRPSKLFEGADMLLAILICSKNKEKQVFSTMYQKWYSDFRDSLFENIKYNNTTKIVIDGSIPKLPSAMYFDILEKIKKKSNNKTILNFINNTPTRHRLYYFRAVQYWVKILDNEPKYLDNGIQTTTGEMKPLFVESESYKFTLISLLSSSLFFVHYINWASCQVINNRDFEFPIDFLSINKKIASKLVELGKKLQVDYQKNSHIVDRIYSKKGREFKMEKQHFYIRKSKEIIDEIDNSLAEHYGLDAEELDFIINYDIKYRLGKELDNEDD